jgi:hypothetical protein
MAGTVPDVAREEALCAARTGWIEDQRAYYENAIIRHGKGASRWTWAGRAMLALALLMAAALAGICSSVDSLFGGKGDHMIAISH